MKDLGEALAFVVFFSFIAVVIFVFEGDPDLWDKWQEAAHKKADAELASQ